MKPREHNGIVFTPREGTDLKAGFFVGWENKERGISFDRVCRDKTLKSFVLDLAWEDLKHAK